MRTVVFYNLDPVFVGCNANFFQTLIDLAPPWLETPAEVRAAEGDNVSYTLFIHRLHFGVNI